MKLIRKRQLFAAIREAKGKENTQVVLQDSITGSIFTLPFSEAVNSHDRLLAVVDSGHVSHENRPLS